MKYLKKYIDKFGFKAFEGYVDDIDPTNDLIKDEFDRLNDILADDDEWKNVVGAEFYEYGVEDIEEYIEEAGIENAEYLINNGLRLTGELNEEFKFSFFNASKDRIRMWKDLSADEKKAFLQAEFDMEPEDVDTIFSENIKDLPEHIRDYFYDNDNDI